MLIDHTREGRQERLYPDTLHTFDLSAIAAELLAQAQVEESGRAGTVLVKTPELRVVLQTLRDGAFLAEHRAPGPITVQVLQGELRFSAEDRVIYLRPGELLALPAGRPHAVDAVGDSAFLLTIGPSGRP